jgi:sugar-specific transcriptional regulator TrmB
MDVQLLEDIGLTKPQAEAYTTLITLGKSSAPELAQKIDESRSNTYKLLDRLVELGMVTKDASGSKVLYFPNSPANLEQFVQRQAAQIQTRERKLGAAMPDLLNFFFAHSAQPSIRYFQGKQGIEQIFSDMLKTGESIYLLRSPKDVSFYDEEFFALFRKKRAKLGIKTYALTPDISSAVHDIELDHKNQFIRTWLRQDEYTAHVEWDVYGNKVALINYAEEAMGIIIENAQVAESFRQVFMLLHTLKSQIGRH